MDVSAQTPLAKYSAALGTLENTDQPSPNTVLLVLLARDDVQKYIDQLPAEQILKLIHLDERLRQSADKLLANTPLPLWRQSMSVDEMAWWWNLETPPHPLDRFDWVWNTLTVTSLAASASLVLDISSKFLAVTPGLFGSFAVIGQSILTLATAGGVLTDAGRRGIEQMLESVGLRRYWWQETKLVMSLLLLFSLIGFRSSLPQISRTLTRLGIENRQTGSSAGAENQLKQAISLDADNAEAHYQLAQVYDSRSQTDKAIIHYQIAAEGEIWTAYVALANLYLTDEQTAAANTLIEEALADIPATEANQPVRSQLSQLRDQAPAPPPTQEPPLQQWSSPPAQNDTPQDDARYMNPDSAEPDHAAPGYVTP
ncbi:MAG: tetratricopeptide repeat protein [Cyanobacteria bacterium P01_A01_bin.114]